MSSRPAAPRIASQAAWQTTSASEWPGQAELVLDLDPAQHELAARGERVGVDADPDPRLVAHAAPRTAASARARSAASVILTLAGSPSTTTTRPPVRSTSCAQSVASEMASGAPA